MSDQERCPTCGSDKKEAQWCRICKAPYQDGGICVRSWLPKTHTFSHCSHPWHDSAPSSKWEPPKDKFGRCTSCGMKEYHGEDCEYWKLKGSVAEQPSSGAANHNLIVGRGTFGCRCGAFLSGEWWAMEHGYEWYIEHIEAALNDAESLTAPLRAERDSYDRQLNIRIDQLTKTESKLADERTKREAAERELREVTIQREELLAKHHGVRINCQICENYWAALRGKEGE